MAYKYRRRKPISEIAKARSMQGAWRKGTNRTETLSIDDAKEIIKTPPTCQYCLLPIPWQELSLDHVIPKSRGGESVPSNLVWTDKRCNLTKGDLNDTEFKALMKFLNRHPKMKESVMGRLRAGGAVYGRRRTSGRRRRR